MYYHKGFTKILTKEARELKGKIVNIAKKKRWKSPGYDSLVDSKLEVTVFVNEDWYYKNGKFKRVDVANREKFMVDSIFEGLNLDDKQIFRIEFNKVQNTESEFSQVIIEAI